mmetsp:Transcript_11956/g.14937  ORF Transcript_11956/g.14937 Transcript_11956/m.14937 type:complete len:86 (-) Transcript_11956:210-467(-)|eukprot:CAMPEP_0172498408 /NCGR_PEP_ID=MMETSP1066-20121228/113413_1 /TAXON_ID=671091 /ORGANISM="Coscinodiscus wailesii, Strain CCMP2513" /LENGTH=85 /DNA_ID=CAMNT_0013271677 /DNA_START=68 /DNA_END=325 /DNA_ORIENTATION=-
MRLDAASLADGSASQQENSSAVVDTANNSNALSALLVGENNRQYPDTEKMINDRKWEKNVSSVKNNPRGMNTTGAHPIQQPRKQN